MIKLGTASVCITPKTPIRLCGFSFRVTPYERVRKDIFAKVFALKNNDCEVFTIYNDLLWWNNQYVDEIKPLIAEKFSVSPQNVIFTASHNHSGPGTGNIFTPELETRDENYVAELKKLVLSGIEIARSNYEDVIVKMAKSTCNLNVYRRVLTENGIKMQPNYDVKVDRDVYVFNFYKNDGSQKGKIVHYPCHANLSKDNDIHPDYPGYALEELEKTCGTAIFLQGFTGDIRPNCTIDGQFVPADENYVIKFASDFVKAVQSATNERELGNEISLIYKTIKLPVEQKLTKEELENTTFETIDEENWKKWVLAKGYPNYEVLRLVNLNIGGINLLFYSHKT